MGFTENYNSTSGVYHSSQPNLVTDHPMTPTSPYCFQEATPQHFGNLPQSCTEDYMANSSNLSHHATANQYNPNLRLVCSSSPTQQNLVAGRCIGSPGELSNCSTATSGASVDYFYRSPVINTPGVDGVGNVTIFMQQQTTQDSISQSVQDHSLGEMPIAVMGSQQQPSAGLWYGYSQFDQAQFHGGEQRIYYENTTIEGLAPVKQSSEVVIHPLLTPRASLC
ncbi:hypothetical protein AA313_de0208761 [Arthrobotrys entomopaga]|nr:hypothetical protein AA313_de0208761 [Arthrobotrys entomopaga]